MFVFAKLWSIAGVANALRGFILTGTIRAVFELSIFAWIAVVGTAVLVFAIVTYLTLKTFAGPAQSQSSTITLSSQTRSSRWLGGIVSFLFFGVLGVWAWFAPISSAAVAPGVVNPEGSRKTVQHLEGGIVRIIHVQEGQQVDAGSTLVTLDNVRALARLDEFRERLIFLLATESRLEAEMGDLDTVRFNFPKELRAEAPQRVEIAQLGQKQLFENRKQTHEARKGILAKQIDQLNEQISGLEEVIDAQNQQLDLVGQELEAVKKLYEQGLQRLSPYLALQREEADLKAERAANKASIAQLGQQIGETELQLTAISQQSKEQVSEELSQVRTELATIRSQIPERVDELLRTEVKAPISGKILNIQVTTEDGGILRPGGEILDIVPDDAALIIDARVRPDDIDNVFPGMKAQVILTAYTQRNLPRIFGTLQSVSADRLIDERTGDPYFQAKVFVEANEVDAIDENVDLIVGMPAEVMLLTGERTLLDFLVKPFSDSIRSSFKEN